MILIDSNVLIDILEADQVWYDWSFAHLKEAILNDVPMVNHVVVAEVSPRSGSIAAFENELAGLNVTVEPFSNEAAYLAGQAFQRYRAHRADRKQGIADFLIGGHAQSLGATILTRDPRFYRAYFPSVPLIAPTKDAND